jgi:glycosyltransferase involved in cell wall biosynthesis
MSRPTFSIILPYFNERDYIRPTLESCLDQTRLPDQLVLVDNASTDESEQLCRDILRDGPAGLETIYLHEAQPGQMHALIAGLKRVWGDYVSIWNADTYYPPHYFATCERVISRGPPDLVAVMAKDIYAAPETWRSRRTRWAYHILARCRPRMCFTGGFGQTFKTSALRDCGGYSLERWPYVLEDHEIVHRICKLGTTRSHPDLWCMPSTRRQDRDATGWTFSERVAYFLTPYACGDWFFYRYLAARLARRKQDFLKLRERDWEGASPAVPQPHVFGTAQRDSTSRR